MISLPCLPCSTLSEVVVPVVTTGGRLLAVLDVDSNHAAAFTHADAQGLEGLCAWLGQQPWQGLQKATRADNANI